MNRPDDKSPAWKRARILQILAGELRRTEVTRHEAVKEARVLMREWDLLPDDWVEYLKARKTP